LKILHKGQKTLVFEKFSALFVLIAVNVALIRGYLNMDLTVLLYKNGYPPEWDDEVFERVLEQAENFKKYAE